MSKRKWRTFWKFLSFAYSSTTPTFMRVCRVFQIYSSDVSSTVKSKLNLIAVVYDRIVLISLQKKGVHNQLICIFPIYMVQKKILCQNKCQRLCSIIKWEKVGLGNKITNKFSFELNHVWVRVSKTMQGIIFF